MDIFEIRKRKFSLMKGLRRDSRVQVSSRDDAQEIFTTCSCCGEVIPVVEFIKGHRVCPGCGAYGKLGARERIDLIVDPGTFREHGRGVKPRDVLRFPGYRQELKNAERASGLKEAFLFGTAGIEGTGTVIGVLDSRFIMGSMGTAVGEKVALAAELAGKRRMPLVIFSASGGARMHEGTVSLMQMAKTAAAIRRFSDGGGFYVSCLTDPTTGGVTASFASLGDIMIAEPGALIGFAGPRVIEQTIGRTLPEGFQRSEFLLEHGSIDMIVPRERLRETLGRILRLHTVGKRRRRHG